MAESHFIHVILRGVPAKRGVRAKSADIVRISPDLAMVNLDVAGEPETVRIDLAKQVFLDSLGNERLDAALEELRGPITGKILRAKPKRGTPDASASKAALAVKPKYITMKRIGGHGVSRGLKKRKRYGDSRDSDTAKAG